MKAVKAKCPAIAQSSGNERTPLAMNSRFCRLSSSCLRLAVSSSDGLTAAPYPSFSIFWMMPSGVAGSIYVTAAVSVARLTLALTTPSMRLNPFSIRAEHAAHVMPVICSAIRFSPDLPSVVGLSVSLSFGLSVFFSAFASSAVPIAHPPPSRFGVVPAHAPERAKKPGVAREPKPFYPPVTGCRPHRSPALRSLP